MYLRLDIEPETRACVNCKHFFQHYQADGARVNMGHCCYPRLKPRKPDDCCQDFSQRKDPERVVPGYWEETMRPYRPGM